ncbi:MAG: hypothetical protein WED05_05845 [Candidatus Atabeyarchaeum deiterrae]
MVYYEAWLGTRKVKADDGEHREYRVEIATPAEKAAPPDYEPLDQKTEKDGKKVYISKWLQTIESARNELMSVTRLIESKACKIVVFFEIRGPC